ncbi:MAG: GNAT family N-acetyltransferase [Microbacterium sp.]
MAYRVDGQDSIFGAAFAVSPSQVVESLSLSGMTREDAIPVAMIIALEALFVASTFRGREFGKDLVDAVEERARSAAWNTWSLAWKPMHRASTGSTAPWASK